MKFAIDYRNGSMGNTMLSHVLYACRQIDIDLDRLWSDVSDTHMINDINHTNLVAHHNLEHPDVDRCPIISVVCQNYDEILRRRMSYSKYYRGFPEPGNFEKFAFDPPKDGDDWLENLTIKFYDEFRRPKINPDTPQISLGEYLRGEIDVLVIEIKKHLGWSWDSDRSKEFYLKIYEKNSAHFNWLDNIKRVVLSTLALTEIGCNLLFWEKAIIMAFVCYRLDIDPHVLSWSIPGRFLEQNNVTLIYSLQEIKKWQNLST